MRERVVPAIEARASRKEAARRFEVSPVSAVRWHETFLQVGRTQAKPMDGDQRSHAVEAKAESIRQIRAKGDAVLVAGHQFHAGPGHCSTERSRRGRRPGHPEASAWTETAERAASGPTVIRLARRDLECDERSLDRVRSLGRNESELAEKYD